MIKNNINLGGIHLTLPNRWFDISDDLPNHYPPTFAREDGVGALQVSVQHFHRGEHAQIDETKLQNLYDEFCISHSIHITPTIESTPERLLIGGMNRPDGIGAWLVSNGRDVVLVTFVVDETQTSDLGDSEMSDVNGIVNSIRLP